MKETHRHEMKAMKQSHQQSLNEVKQAYELLSQAHERQFKELEQKYQRILDEVERSNGHQQEEIRNIKWNQTRQKDRLLEQARIVTMTEVEKVSNSLDKVEAQIQAISYELREKQRSLQREIDDQRKIVTLKTHATCCPLPRTPFYFTIINLDHYQKNNYMFNSGPFYSHPGGYKMMVTVYPNGARERKGTHVSIYIGICLGEFDDSLKWPFDGAVTIQAYNRTLKEWSAETTVTLNDTQCDLGTVNRPVNTLVDSKKGCSDFIPLDNFAANYVKSTNAARFKVVGVCI